MSDKWRQGQQREIPDEEPLPPEELARMDLQRTRSQSALISRAASQGMTPMELFASGQVSAHEPDDRLAFDKSRRLPAASAAPQISEEETLIAIDPARSVDEHEVTVFVRKGNGPWKAVGTAEPDSLKMTVVKPSAPGMPIAGVPTGVHPIHGRGEVHSDLRSRMEEWLARDGGRSFMEGFNDYFGTPTPRAHEEEAVPPTSEPIDDDEVVDGEVVPSVSEGTDVPEDDDIVDAEVVDDPGPEGSDGGPTA